MEPAGFEPGTFFASLHEIVPATAQLGYGCIALAFSSLFSKVAPRKMALQKGPPPFPQKLEFRGPRPKAPFFCRQPLGDGGAPPFFGGVFEIKMAPKKRVNPIELAIFKAPLKLNSGI